MTNADKFKAVFGMYSEEFWAKPEQDMLSWINSEVSIPKRRQASLERGLLIIALLSVKSALSG